MATALAPSDGPRSRLRAVGLLLPLCLGAAVVAKIVHAAGPLAAAPYTWGAPVDILREVFATPFAVAWLLAAFVLGRIARPDALAEIRRATKERVAAKPVLACVAAGAVLAALDGVLFSRHTLLDQAAVLFGGAFAASRVRGLVGRRALGVLGEIALTVVVFTLVSYSFTVAKAHLFLVRRVHDDWLLAGPSLLGEPLHRVIAAWASSRPDVVLLADAVYFRLFEHMAIVSLFLTGLGLPHVRQRYLTALSLAYLIGGVAYFVIPAVGPVFYDGAAFGYLRKLPLRSTIVQKVLLTNTGAAGSHVLEILPTYGFVAAMPSLHMAHELIMLWYARGSRIFVAGNALFTLLVAAAVVILGWHYPIDIVGGALLAALAIALASRPRLPWMPASIDAAPPSDATEPTEPTEEATDAPETISR